MTLGETWFRNHGLVVRASHLSKHRLSSCKAQFMAQMRRLYSKNGPEEERPGRRTAREASKCYICGWYSMFRAWSHGQHSEDAKDVFDYSQRERNSQPPHLSTRYQHPQAWAASHCLTHRSRIKHTFEMRLQTELEVIALAQRLLFR